MSRLRVAFVAPSLGILGGQAVQANRLLNAWRDDRDIDAWLVPVNPAPPPGLRWTSKVTYVRTAVTQAMYLPLLVREIARADVVHVFSASFSSFILAPMPAILIARLLGRPVVLNYRSGAAAEHLRGSALARRVIASVDRNVVPSQFLVDVFGSFGIDAMSIPNVVDLKTFAFRERSPVRPHLVSTRNFDEGYNVACTLRAFAIVQRRWPDATLTLVGRGTEEPALRSMVSSLGLRNVAFPGSVDPAQISAYYAAADIYIQSPNVDNMPTSVLEAFASGLPVVSTGAGGIPAILTHGEHGLLAPLDDAGMLAEHVLQLIDAPDIALRLTRHAYETCQRCTWTAVRGQWLDAYRGVLRAAPATTRANCHVA